MALLFADGFDHYGSDETNMLDGTYATASNVTLVTATNDGAPPATGTHCLRIDDSGVATSSLGIRKVLPTAKDKLGVAARFYVADMPSNNTELAIFNFIGSTVNECQVTCFLDSNGAIRFYRGADGGSGGGLGTLIAVTDPIVVASAWNHIEIQVYIHDTAGWVRVAVNGVHRYEGTGLDTKHSTANIVSVSVEGFEHLADTPFYIDDFQIYDFVGDSGVDTDWVPPTDGSGIATGYIGELQVVYLPPNADTAEADWAKSTGTDGYALIDETTPNDTDYIYSDAATDLSEFALTDLPPEITYIRGLMVIGRMSKSDSGAAMVQFGMKSVADVTDAAERPVTVEPTYWWDFINVDPDSGARWTRASLNAAWVRLTRSV